MTFLRTIFLIAGTAAAYALLRGWPDALPPVVRACAAVLLLVAALGLWARREKSGAPAASGRRAPGLADYTAISGAVLATECAFVWLLSASPVPLENLGATLEEHLRPAAAAAREAETREVATGGGNWLWDDQTRRPLPRRTDFQPGNKPEVFIRLNDRGDAAELLHAPVYVRAFAFGRYERAGWSPLPGEPATLAADAAGFVEFPARPGRAIAHEVFHAADATGNNALVAIQGAVAARVPQLVRVGDGLHLLPPPQDASGYQYLAASAPRRLDDLSHRRDLSPAEAPAALTDLPSGNLTPRVRDLARLAAGEGSLVRRLLNVQNHLRTTLGYSLRTENARDLDPIENFLFHEQRGHCEYFATAGALLARSLGVPARTAYGWAGGTYYEPSNMFVFRAREAHAWTEVWLEGEGWVVMDPTPPAAIGGDVARVAPPGELPPTADAAQSSDENPAHSSTSGPAPATAGLALMACFGLPAMMVLAGRRLARRPVSGAGETGSAEILPPPDYLVSWRRAAARRGRPMTAGMTLRRHLAEVADAPFAAELQDYHYRTRYEGGAPDPKTEKRLIAEIRAWENAVAQTSISNPGR